MKGEILMSLVGFLFWVKFAEAFVLEGSPTSYAQFRKWYPTANSSIKFEFKSRRRDGILLYTDDGGYYDFIEIKLVNGSVRVRYNFGKGSRVLKAWPKERRQGDWHSVEFTRNPNGSTALILDGNMSRDETPIFTNSSFGNFSQNSHVYVGGLPSWYMTKLSNLALPSVVFEPRFRGAIRNLVYGDDISGIPKRQEVMAYKGVRASTVDACDHHNPCQNGGVCISTDGGPLCDCKYIDFDGVFCERGHEAVEITLSGKEFLSYDLLKLAGQPILSDSDEISLHFKTDRPDGVIFFTGDGKEDYLIVSIKDGTISLIIQLGMGQLNTGITHHQLRFDDDAWHHLIIKRTTKRVTMNVDGIYLEKWMTTGMFYMLASSKVFIGKKDDSITGINEIPNFAGCLKKVRFKADSLYLPLLKLAKEANRLININGRIAFQCRSTFPIVPVAFTSGNSYLANFYTTRRGGIVSFTRPQSFMILPKWNSTISGTFSFSFRTNEANGMIFFNQGSAAVQKEADLFSIELLEGYLYVHLNLGTGSVKVRSSNRRLDDGTWHKVEIFRNLKSGTAKVNEDFHEFETPGEAYELDLEGPLYVGGLNALEEVSIPPPGVWSASLKYGFVGCLRDLEMNGVSLDLHEYNKDAGSIKTSCHITPPKCTNRPCMHGGRCRDGWGRYICDCKLTSFSGPTCGEASPTISFNGKQRLSVPNPGTGASEAENIVFRFKTTRNDGFLFGLRDMNGGEFADKLEISLVDGEVQVFLKLGLTEKKLRSGSGLGNDLWHTATFKRRGMILSLAIDDNAPVLAEAYGSDSVLDYDTLEVAGRQYNMESFTPFEGQIQQFAFNGIEYFEKIRSGTLLSSYSLTGVFSSDVSEVFQDVTFLSQFTYMGLPQLKAHTEINLNFHLRTLEPDGLLMYNAGKNGDFLAVELANGHIHYVLNLGYGVIRLKDNSPKKINDNKWHSVTIGRPSTYRHTLRVDTYHSSSNSRGNESTLDLDGILFLGGVRKNMYGKLPPQILSKYGFQGCIASINLNGEAADPINNALVPSNQVSEGCDESVESSRNSYELSEVDLYSGGQNFHRKQQIRNHFRQIQRTSISRDRCFCENDGICLDHFTTPTCDCDLTSFTGQRCSEESVAYEWLEEPGLVRYNFPYDKRPDTRIDVLSLGLITPSEESVIVRIDSASSNDFLELKIVKGYPKVTYNLGTEDISIEDTKNRISDGNYHVVKFTRSEANSTLQIDDNPTNYKYPMALKRQLTVFNSQSHIHIGGKWNPSLHRVENSYKGIIAGLVYNGLRPLDLVANKDKRAKIHGRNVHLVENIPFDYRDTHYQLFSGDLGLNGKHQMQMTNPSKYPEPGINDDLVYGRLQCDSDEEKYYDPRCFVFEGSGDELITPVYTPPANPVWKNKDKFQNCDDEEDCNTSNEGSGGIPHKGLTTNIPDSKSSFLTTTTTWTPWDTTMETVAMSTSMRTNFIDEEDLSTTRPQITYENYDKKYNVYDNEPEPKSPIYDDRPRVSSAATSGTIMVISIILVALIAVILIVFIVLRMRTRDDERGYKVEESRTYQFNSNSVVVVGSSSASKSDLDEGEGGSLLGGGGSLNGFYARNLAVVKKPSSSSTSSKPVREWYV